MFELFDPNLKVDVTTGNLPHWFQPGVTYFITFRTADSLPRAVAEKWYQGRDAWLQSHHIDPSREDWQQSLAQLPRDQQIEFREQFSKAFQELLDRGYGECVLRRPDLASIVGDSFHYFDGVRYHLGDFVVMPNHIHLIVGMLGGTNIREQCRSWKKYTATKINQALGRKGEFWQVESFDHLIRSADQFDYLCHYIAENPRKAKLTEGTYLHWERPK